MIFACDLFILADVTFGVICALTVTHAFLRFLFLILLSVVEKKIGESCWSNVQCPTWATCEMWPGNGAGTCKCLSSEVVHQFGHDNCGKNFLTIFSLGSSGRQAPAMHRPARSQARYVTDPLGHIPAMSQACHVTGPLCHRPALSQTR